MARFAEWTPELEAALAEPFPSEWVKQKSTGGAKISFVPWHRYVSKLNELVGHGWSMGTPITLHVGDKLILGLPITILGTTRLNVGDEDDSEWEEVLNKETGELEDKKTLYGSPCTNAFAQAFKRTCALFGLGLYLYNKGGAASAPSGNQSAKPAQTNTPPKAAVGFNLDAPIGKGAHKSETWKALAESGEKGREYIAWALGKWTDLSPEAKRALADLLESYKAGPIESVLLEDKLNAASAVGAITDVQAADIQVILDSRDTDQMRVAKDWLETMIAKRKVGGSV